MDHFYFIENIGYHFALYAEENGNTMLVVRGEHEQSPAIGIVDAETGELLSARQQVPDSFGGIMVSTDEGMTWTMSDLNGVFVTAITVDLAVADTAYASILVSGRIQIYRTQDGGQSWTSLGALPAEAGNWAYDLKALPFSDANQALIVGTPTGLWISEDAAQSWQASDTIPAGPPQWMAVLREEDAFTLLVSLTAGENAGLYASTSLDTWNRVAAGSFRLSPSYDHRSVLAVDENRPGTALLLNQEGQAELPVPPHTLRAAGDFTRRDPMLVEAPEGLFRSQPDTIDQQTWESSLGTNLASLAVPPDYPSSGLVIAGGFRTGVFRSADFGQSWDTVVTPEVLSTFGTSEVSAVAFLSNETVILVNGGKFSRPQ